MPNSPFSSSDSASRMTVRLDAGTNACAEAARLLRAGRLVAFPTETVYGLGADATDSHAVARLYAAKGRPSFNPLIAHVADVPTALELGHFDATARRLAEAFWPGPLTIVVPASEDCPVCELARAGLPSLAIRVPDHPVARAVLLDAGRPIAAPSANRSGHVSPTKAAHVAADLDGIIDAIIDGGACDIGVESTIIACLDGAVTLLRPGGISREAITWIMGAPLLKPASNKAAVPLAPGQLSSHYAPRTPIRLDVIRVESDEVCLGFGSTLPEGAVNKRSLNLSVHGSLVEAAANLYHYLRELDAFDATCICCAPFPSTELGEAIRDRLERASAPR